MHELPVVNHILEIVLRHAEKANATRVTEVRLKIGELSDLQDDWFKRYFDYVSRDTIAAGATLRIERMPVVFLCTKCKKTFPVKIREIEGVCCPFCGEGKVTFLSGREFQIKEIEVI